MRIQNEATKRNISPALDWIGSLMGAELDKRVATFERHERSNPLLANHFREHFSLEFALADARKYRRNTGRPPKGPAYEQLYSFLIPVHRIYRALPSEVKKPFEGRLRTALNGAHGIRPFAYEISIATHVMQKGWDIEFADYAGAGQFDFLARMGSTEIEIECKATSGDTGRKIHRQEVNRLADLILPTTQQLADLPGCHLISVTIPGRLGKSTAELSNIAAAVSAAASQNGSASNPFCDVDYRMADVSEWPEPPYDGNFLEFFEKQFGVGNSHLLFHGRPGVSVVAVMIRSAQADSVVVAIAEQAKKAGDQCSGKRPALILLHLIDPIGRPDLDVLLRTPNGMHSIAGAVFNGDKRLHVDSIGFTVPQRPRRDIRRATQLSGDVVVLNNPRPQFPCDLVRTVFRSNDRSRMAS